MKLQFISGRTLCCILLLAGTAALGQDQVHELADKWTAAYNAYDHQALGALYSEDAALMMHGAPTVVGRKNIEAFWAADFEDSSPLTLLSVTHSIEGVDMTLVHGDYQVVNRDNGELIGEGRFAHIWVKADNGEWLLDRDLWAEPFDPYSE